MTKSKENKKAANSNFIHLHLHTEYSALDGGCKVKKLADKAKSMGMHAVGISDHGTMAAIPSFVVTMQEAGIKPIIGCLPAGHLIDTPTGAKPIEDIKEGDLVITHKGRARKVVGTMKRPHRGDIYGLRVDRSKKRIWITEEHPVLVLKNGEQTPDWVRADELVAGRKTIRGGISGWNSYAVIPKGEPTEYLHEIFITDSLGSPYQEDKEGLVQKVGLVKGEAPLRCTNIRNAIPVTPKLARLMGLFVAEGSFGRNTYGPTQMNWSFSINEMHLAKEVETALHEIFNIHCVIKERPNKSIIEVRCDSAVLARWMETQTMKGALNKQIPGFIFNSNDDCAKAFIEGLVDGDGHRAPSGQIRVKIGSVSLAYGLRRLLRRFNYLAPITKREERPYFKGKQIDKICISYTVHWNPEASFRHSFADDENIYTAIRDIELKKDYDGFVYNFEVEEDHSYISDIALHNCEIYLTDDRFIKTRESNTWHLGLIAKTSEGYYNLCQISSRAFLDGFYYRPRADWDLLAAHSEGLIALTGCMAAPVMNSLMKQGSITEAREYTKRLIETFGQENVYAEIQNVGITTDIPEDSELAIKLGKPNISQTEANRELAEIAKELGIKLVATGDVHYLEESDAEPHDAMVCIGTGQLQKGPRKFSLLPKKYYFRSEAEMLDKLKEWPEALTNTLEIVDRCDDNVIEFGLNMLPKFPIPEEFADAGAYLRHLCEEGMVERYGPREKQTAEQRDRLDFELGVIERMGFNDYFLIVWDFYREALERGIAAGPGRGSGAGSIAAYCLQITQLDPLTYGLLFERFLNPDRKSMPDFDCDFSIYRREELIEYVREKYNTLADTNTAVSQIITFGRIGAKAGIRDACRVLGHPLNFGDRLAKMVPERPVNITLKEAYEQSKQMQAAFKNDPASKEIIQLAGWLEGFVRNEGIHAAGVVIWDKALETIMPIQQKGAGKPITTAYEMKYAEKIGALKMDFLGLRNLDVIQLAMEIIDHTEGVKLHPYKIDIHDAPTYELLARGEAIGVFQFESDGMRGALRLVKPTELNDLIALVALYRPGPMAHIPSYAARKANLEEVTYPDPRAEDILKETYGIVIYQEQSMLVARELAGFTPGEADDLRKAIGKKLHDLMASLKPQFIKGCQENGISKEVAEEMWKDNEAAADYSFNKAHAACYAYLSYVTAYLKCHHPEAYMAALLSSVMGVKDKVPFYLQEARRMGLRVLPPDINRSFKDFSIHEVEEEDQTEDYKHKYEILFGLTAIKRVGEGVVQEIREEREANGPFRSIYDLIRRMPHFNKTTFEQLIRGGALDVTGDSRRSMLAVVEPTLEVMRKEVKDREKIFLKEALEKFAIAENSDGAQELDLFGQLSNSGKTGRKKWDPLEKKVVESIAKVANAKRNTPDEKTARAIARETLEKSFMLKAKKELKDQGITGEDLDQQAGSNANKMFKKEGKPQIDHWVPIVLPVLDTYLAELAENEQFELAMAESIDTELSKEDWTWAERLNHEFDALGVYASGHPLDECKKEWARYITLGLGDITSEYENKKVTVCGVVTGVRLIQMKNGKQMAAITLDDLSGSKEVTFFSDAIEEGTLDMLGKGETVVIRAVVKEDLFQASKNDDADEANAAEAEEADKPVKLIAQSAHPWYPEQIGDGPVQVQLPEEWLENPADLKRKLTQINAILKRHEGDDEVHITAPNGKTTVNPHRVDINHILMRELRLVMRSRKAVK